MLLRKTRHKVGGVCDRRVGMDQGGVEIWSRSEYNKMHYMQFSKINKNVFKIHKRY